MNFKSNIPKLYLSFFLSGSVFFYGIEKVFYDSIGIDAVGISAISITYLIIALIFDVPSGILADKWSRKKVLILAGMMMIVACVVLGLSQNLIHYMIGAAIWGGYFIFISGTYEAITYDSLHEQGRTKEFSRVLGRENALFMMGIVVTSLASGFIADLFSLRATYFLSIIPALLNIGVIAWMVEPKFHDEIIESRLFAHMKRAGGVLVSSRVMQRLSLLLIASIILEEHTDEFAQVYFISLGFAAVGVGILSGVYAWSAALGQFFAHRFSSHLNTALLGVTVAFAIFSFWESTYGLVFFMLAMLLRNMVENLSETQVQDSISSSVRATTVSVIGFLGNLLTIPLMLAFGYIVRENDIFAGFQALSIGLIIFTIVMIFWPKNHLA